MPQTSIYQQDSGRHSDDIQDIITSPPSWLLTWGITMFCFVIVSVFCLSAFINYPDIVKAQLKITSISTTKPVVTKVSGRITALLIRDDIQVKSGQALAYLESTANHNDVLKLLNKLYSLQRSLLEGNSTGNLKSFSSNKYNLGELQTFYQSFYQELISYQAAINDGTWIRKNKLLKIDLVNLLKQKVGLEKQKQLQEKDYDLASQDLEMNKKLLKEKVETLAEFRQAESKYLSKQYPILQTETALITLQENISAKQKEILEAINTVREQQERFVQYLNTLISQIQEWRTKYILMAPQSGKASYVGLLQQNMLLQAGQEVFNIDPGNENYFGEMSIPQFNFGKVKVGQSVIIKLKSYPYEEFGLIRGRINRISNVPNKDSMFLSSVVFNSKTVSIMKHPILLKQGMLGDAEIITENATLLQRLVENFIKMINK